MSHVFVSWVIVCLAGFSSLLFVIDVTARESIERLERLIARLMAFIQFLRTLRALRA